MDIWIYTQWCRKSSTYVTCMFTQHGFHCDLDGHNKRAAFMLIFSSALSSFFSSVLLSRRLLQIAATCLTVVQPPHLATTHHTVQILPLKFIYSSKSPDLNYSSSFSLHQVSDQTSEMLSVVWDCLPQDEQRWQKCTKLLNVIAGHFGFISWNDSQHATDCYYALLIMSFCVLCKYFWLHEKVWNIHSVCHL